MVCVCVCAAGFERPRSSPFAGSSIGSVGILYIPYTHGRLCRLHILQIERNTVRSVPNKTIKLYVYTIQYHVSNSLGNQRFFFVCLPIFIFLFLLFAVRSFHIS